jgi:hypothetical protein
MSLPKGTSLFYRESKKRWVLSYADPVRGQPQKVLPKEIRRQRDAEVWALEWLRVQGLRPDAVLAQRRAEGLTVAACAEKWLGLRERDSRVAPATLTNNRAHVENWILPRFGTTPIAALEVPELRAFIRDLREQRAASTVRNIYSTFCTLYADAMAEGWVKSEANIVQHPGVQREVPELECRGAVRLPLEWAAALIGDPRVALEWRARYAVAFTSGARDGEIGKASPSRVSTGRAAPWLAPRPAADTRQARARCKGLRACARKPAGQARPWQRVACACESADARPPSSRWSISAARRAVDVLSSCRAERSDLVRQGYAFPT